MADQLKELLQAIAEHDALPKRSGHAPASRAENEAVGKVFRAARAVAASAPAHSAEVLGKTCIDGGTCHHKCTTRCFRRECCTHFSDYTGPWAYDKPATALDVHYSKGFTDQSGDCGKFEAGINVGAWMQRIVAYGDTAEDAERMRDVMLEALTRPAQTEQQPIYLYRRKGQDAFATCDEDRFDELSTHHLFETKLAYAAPSQPAVQEPYPHDHPLHKAVFLARESYTGNETFEDGVRGLIAELKDARKAQTEQQPVGEVTHVHADGSTVQLFDYGMSRIKVGAKLYAAPVAQTAPDHYEHDPVMVLVPRRSLERIVNHRDTAHVAGYMQDELRPFLDSPAPDMSRLYATPIAQTDKGDSQ